MPICFLYLLSIILQGEGWRGASVGVCQELSGQVAVPSHQQEASRGAPACVLGPLLVELVTLLPARASQGDAAGEDGSRAISSTCHKPILGVVIP